MFFTTMLLWSAFFIASQLLTPAPKMENARAAGLDDFNFPTATEGRIIPLMWGTDKIKGPNVMWYGDLRIVPIKEKVKVSMFKSKSYIKGYRYYIGFQMGICTGEATLKKIWIGDELVWSGTQSTDGDIQINSKFAQGTFSFYTGSDSQSVDSYLAVHQTPTPAYRGICHGVFKAGFVGESTNIKPWSFEVERITDGLSLGGNATVNSYDANPMNIVYEILTNADWGYGYADADIDLAALVTIGNTLYTEGNGFSMTLSSPRQAGDILDEIERQCDCRRRLDSTTGKFTVALIRDGYSTSGLKVANNSTVLEVQEYSRATWEGTVNYVRVQYKRRANDYTDGYAPAQDGANMQAQNRKVPATYNFPGCKDDALANSLAWREIRANSYPLAKARLKVNREFWSVFIGEPILFTYSCDEFDVVELPMRVIKADLGDPEHPEIVIDVVQDVFTYMSPSFSAPDPSSWTAPDQDLTPFPADEQVAFEAPYAMSRRDEDPNEHRIWCGGASQGRKESGAIIRQRNGVVDPSSGDFYDAGTINAFMYIGTLQSTITPNSTSIEILTDMGVTELKTVGDWELGQDLVNLIMIEGEFLSSGTPTAISGGVSLATPNRGMLDSAQRAHIAGADVYFIDTGGVLTTTSFPADYHVDIRLLPYRDEDQVAIAEGDGGLTEVEIDLDYRERRPYPPTDMEVNSTLYPAATQSLDLGGGVDTKGLAIDYIRRDFRIYDELSQLHTDASGLVGDFPSNNSTVYRLRIYNDPAGAGALIFTGAFLDAASLVVTRTQILAATAGVIPTTLRASITAQHSDLVTPTTRNALDDLYFDFPVDSAEFAPDYNWGVVSVVDTYTANWTAPDTGNYAFVLGTSGPSVWASVNGGAEQQIIIAGNTTGTLTGVVASDTIKVKYKGSVTGTETCVTVGSPVDTEDAYVIFE